MAFSVVTRPVCGFLALMVVFSVPSTLRAQDALFRANALHTGVFAAPGVPEFHKVKWQFRSKGPIVSSPIVSGDSVFIGSNDHNFYALDLTTGNVKWKYKTGSRIQGSAAVSNGLVFFGDPAHYRKEYREAQTVTGADVKRVANKYLTKGRIVLSIVPMGQVNQASKPAESKPYKAVAQ